MINKLIPICLFSLSFLLCQCYCHLDVYILTKVHCYFDFFHWIYPIRYILNALIKEWIHLTNICHLFCILLLCVDLQLQCRRWWTVWPSCQRHQIWGTYCEAFILPDACSCKGESFLLFESSDTSLFGVTIAFKYSHCNLCPFWRSFGLHWTQRKIRFSI